MKKNIFARLYNYDEDLAGIVLIILILVVSIQVFSRYIFNSPLQWTIEIAELLFVWLIFIGGSVGVRKGSLHAVKALQESISEKKARYLSVAVNVVVLFFLGLVIFQGFRVVQGTMQQTMPVTRLPKAAVFAAVPTTGIWMMIHVVRNIRDLFKDG